MSETGRERYWRQVRELAEQHGVEPGEARRLWPRYYHTGGRPKVRVAITATFADGSLCPFCREELPAVGHPEACEQCGSFEHPAPSEEVPCEPAPDLWTCSRCGSTAHQECIDEFGSGCPTLGCGVRRRVRSARITIGAVRERLNRLRRGEPAEPPRPELTPEEREWVTPSFLRHFSLADPTWVTWTFAILASIIFLVLLCYGLAQLV